MVNDMKKYVNDIMNASENSCMLLARFPRLFFRVCFKIELEGMRSVI